MLKVDNLNVYYGESHVIRNVSFELGEHETIAVMGRNGMGKTTLFKSLIGILPARSGSVALDGAELTRRKSYERVATGLAYVPQGRMIFPYLTVEENILTGMENVPDKTVPQYVYDTFPVLWEMRKRRGGNLSGGQQQQLAIARALVTKPKVLVAGRADRGHSAVDHQRDRPHTEQAQGGIQVLDAGLRAGAELRHRDRRPLSHPGER